MRLKKILGPFKILMDQNCKFVFYKIKKKNQKNQNGPNVHESYIGPNVFIFLLRKQKWASLESTDHTYYGPVFLTEAQKFQFRILSAPYPSRQLLVCKALCHLLRNRTLKGSLSLSLSYWVFYWRLKMAVSSTPCLRHRSLIAK